MTADNPPEGRGRLFENHSRKARWVLVWQTPVGLLLQGRAWNGVMEGEALHWETDQINYALEEGGTEPMLRLYGPDDAILEIRDRALISVLVDGHPVAAAPGFGIALASVLGVVLVTAIGVVVGADVLSQRLAGSLPAAWEARLGETMHNQLVSSFCESTEQADIMERLISRLTRGMPLPPGAHVKVHLINTGQVNAYALPGGEVLIEDALLKLTSDADEVAAVVAHEVQHVAQHHVMARLLRGAWQNSLWNVALRDYTGSVPLDAVAVRRLVSLPFDRSAEARADIEAVRMLAAAHIDSAALERLLSKMETSTRNAGIGGLPEILSSHPSDGHRREALRKSLHADTARTTGPRANRPALSESEWIALHEGCVAKSEPAKISPRSERLKPLRRQALP